MRLNVPFSPLARSICGVTQNPENRRALQKIDILGRNTRFAPEAHV
ncbi:BQ5605_C017g08457 [Microbotryum silenes-dioicae]|uniref:BQ5605_C017g08457 protein n=1 Tax=Microbotryum silenes-dioicae TaxID=796604 RepID=A0A2X0LUS2_9BASI|nr:BQ5605_C017g08457 [Microbotryum silenes-dioicae]